MKYFTCVFLVFCSFFLFNFFVEKNENINFDINKTNEVLENGNFVKNQVIVTLDERNSKLNKIPDFSFFKNLEVEKIVNLTPRKKIGHHEKHYRMILLITLKNTGKQYVAEAIKHLQKIKGISRVEPNVFLTCDSVPNDPYYNNYENLENQWGLRKINLESCWDITSGNENIRVGIIDTGIGTIINNKPYHPDLTDNIDSLGGCFIDSSNATPTKITDDYKGHGTHVAGIVGAIGNNNIGISGVNWRVKLVPLKVFDYIEAIASDCVNAIDYATNLWESEQRIHILNFSLSTTLPIPCVENAIRNFPGLFVCSVGNTAQDNDITHSYPSFYGSNLHPNNVKNILSIGNINSSDSLTETSNWGRYTVSLFAPGHKIISTFPMNLNTDFVQGYKVISGSSMATPHVSGVAALLLSYNCDLNYLQLKNIILKNVRKINSLQNKCFSGGILDAKSAIESIAYHTTLLEDNTLRIDRPFSNLKEYVIIPEKIKGHLVTKIGNNAFENNTELNLLKLPPNITEIGDNAFKNCINLFGVNTLKASYSYGTNIFLNCPQLYNTTSYDNEQHTHILITFSGNVEFTDNHYYNHSYIPLYSYYIKKHIECCSCGAFRIRFCIGQQEPDGSSRCGLCNQIMS